MCPLDGGRGLLQLRAWEGPALTAVSERLALRQSLSRDWGSPDSFFFVFGPASSGTRRLIARRRPGRNFAMGSEHGASSQDRMDQLVPRKSCHARECDRRYKFFQGCVKVVLLVLVCSVRRADAFCVARPALSRTSAHPHTSPFRQQQYEILPFPLLELAIVPLACCEPRLAWYRSSMNSADK